MHAVVRTQALSESIDKLRKEFCFYNLNKLTLLVFGLTLEGLILILY
jgi:hypothetical protein